MHRIPNWVFYTLMACGPLGLALLVPTIIVHLDRHAPVEVRMMK